MHGPEFARDAIATGLADIIPIKWPRLRAAHGLGDEDLPQVDIVVSGEKPHGYLNEAGSTWVEVVINRMVNMRAVDIDEIGDRVYRIRYAARVYVWTLGETWNDSIDRRDRVAGAVRQTLLEFPTLRLQGGDGDVLIEHDRWTEDYGVPVPTGNRSERHWTSAALAFEAICEQTLAAGRVRDPIGEAERMALSTTTWTMQPMPPDAPTPATPITPAPPPEPDPAPVPEPEPDAPAPAPVTSGVTVEVHELPFTKERS